MQSRVEQSTLVIKPETDLIASRIEELRDFFMKQIEEHPDLNHVILDAHGIKFVDSLGVNLIVGLYRQLASASKSLEINGAGKNFMKVAGFFRFSSLFPVNEETENT